MRALRLPSLLCLLLVMQRGVGAAPLIVNDYYEETRTVACSSQYSCRLEYAATPAGRYLDVEQLACEIERNTQIRSVALGLSDLPGQQPKRYIAIPVTVNAAESATNYFAINHTFRFRIGAGKTPLVLVDNLGASTANFTRCTITGTLIPY